MKAVGVIFSNIHDRYMPEFTKIRTMASIPFGGRYRLIDFALSNMINADIYKVGVITRNNYQSLMDHLGSGKSWDLSRKNGGLIVLPPFGVADATLYTSRLEALKNIMRFLNRCKEEFVVLTDCNFVCNINYADVLEKHEKSNADITMVYKNMDINTMEMTGITALDLDSKQRVVGCRRLQTAKEKKADNLYLNMMVLRKTFLEKVVLDAISRGQTSFIKDIIQPSLQSLNINGYEYKGYFGCIDSLVNYYERSMDLLKKDIRDELFNDRNHQIYTKAKDSAPTKYGIGANVKQSLIADGCEIYGEVENSILFRGVKIGKNASVKNSIVLQDGAVYQNSTLNCVIADKNVVVNSNRVLSGCETQPFYISKNSIV